MWWQFYFRVVCPLLSRHFTHWLAVYFNRVFLTLSRAAPCPPRSEQTSWIDPLNWCLMVPLCAGVMLKNPHLVSNPPPKAPILHWSCSVCTLATYYVCLLCASLPQQTLAKSRSTPRRENVSDGWTWNPFWVEIRAVHFNNKTATDLSLTLAIVIVLKLDY